jgi:hypothetical protein
VGQPFDIVQPDHHPGAIGQPRQRPFEVDPLPAFVDARHVHDLQLAVIRNISGTDRGVIAAFPAQRGESFRNRDATDPRPKGTVASKPADAANNLEKGLLKDFFSLLSRSAEPSREGEDRPGKGSVETFEGVEIAALRPGKEHIVNFGKKTRTTSHYLEKMHPDHRRSQAPVVISKE